MPASTGFVGKGVTLEIDDGASTFTGVINLSTVNISGRDAEEIDFTHLGSTGSYREFQQGFKDPGTLEFQVQFDPTSGTHDGSTNGLEGLLNSGANRSFRLNYVPKGERHVGTGFIKGVNVSVGLDNAVTADVTLRVSGQMTLETIV